MAPYPQRGSPEGSPRSTTLATHAVSTVTTTGTASNSYSTKGVAATSTPSITSVRAVSTTATPTYITKGSPTPNTSLRGSHAPSQSTVQGTTLAFILIITLLLGIALGVFAWKKGWGYRLFGVGQKLEQQRQHQQPPPKPSPSPTPSELRRADSNVTLVDESSLRTHRGRSWERGVAAAAAARVETSELRFHGDGSVRHVETVVRRPENVVRRPEKAAARKW